MQRKALISVIGGATATVALAGVGTHLLAGTESTTSLDRFTAVTVDGHKALAADIVAGRAQSKFHPLPWVGTKVSRVSCPTGLKAVAGASITCTGHTGKGKDIDIPVTVVTATGTSVTWKFER
ncbi:hypothetical protein GCM10023084_23870 [Streptomyces lacrimifluminis]|uniref:DUF4333 domain-containing protein n=1 Tax=Streptomyces lacrimifluminis TaxID=1500077 RepID=A0A917NPB0_9ACTN|nr:DUF4333 domain-containing protein [Streptomyces lacrimifluminis]GGJ15340.1 hypothetical protein GCM10012282_09400 [Streptomyces lacrimifluminis]